MCAQAVVCPAAVPSCPPCSSTQACTFVPATCEACATALCTNKISIRSSSASETRSGRTAAVIGGVLGGAVLLAIVAAVISVLLRRRRKGTQGHGRRQRRDPAPTETYEARSEWERPGAGTRAGKGLTVAEANELLKAQMEAARSSRPASPGTESRGIIAWPNRLSYARGMRTTERTSGSEGQRMPPRAHLPNSDRQAWI